MNLKSGVNLRDFLEDVRMCEGEVTFETEDGDVLNLKSVLSMYLFSKIAGNRDFVLNGHVVCRCEADRKRLEKYSV